VGLGEQLAEKSDWIPVRETAAVQHAPALRLVESSAWAPRAMHAPSGYRFAKRATDVVISLLMIALLAPLLVLIALIIRFDSSGPAMFRQWRTGLDGQVFRVWKFRTLSVVEDGDGIAQVTKEDPRVTRVGRFLRRTSIDELPQLLNVLRGEMSLVGPRPHACAHDRYFAARIENYAIRHSVKPGLTGWAQVNGLRGETATIQEMSRRVVLDLWYIRHARFALDMRILIATPGAVLFGRNAW
jgi:putative colanic acid biosysnthesis UDP-glucose lipid carrier transferase